MNKLFKKWWFWLLVVIIVAIILFLPAFSCNKGAGAPFDNLPPKTSVLYCQSLFDLMIHGDTIKR